MRIKKIPTITPRLLGRQTASRPEIDLPTPGEDEDQLMQSALLHHVLERHPTLLRQCDLVRELCQDQSSFDERDAIDRAIGDLVKAGLLDRNDNHVLPTPPAIHFDKLPRL